MSHFKMSVCHATTERVHVNSEPSDVNFPYIAEGMPSRDANMERVWQQPLRC